MKLSLLAPPGMMRSAYFICGLTNCWNPCLMNLLYLVRTSLTSLPLSLISLVILRASAKSSSQTINIFKSIKSRILSSCIDNIPSNTIILFGCIILASSIILECLLKQYSGIMASLPLLRFNKHSYISSNDKEFGWSKS